MIYDSPLDLTSDVDVFKAISEADKDTKLGKMRQQCSPLFDKKTLDRFYFHNGHNGVAARIYENNSIELLVSNGLADVVTINSLNIVVGPVRRFTNYMMDTTGHTADGKQVHIPKNNLDKNQMVIVDLSTSTGKLFRNDIDVVRFDMVPPNQSEKLMFLPDSMGKYKLQKDHVNNYYMPPNKAIRKEYRDKINALITKVTLLSFLKDDHNKKIEAPKDLENLAHTLWKEPLANQHEAIFAHVDGSYESQLFMKLVLDKSFSGGNNHHYYSRARDLVQNMIKYYTQFRNEVEVEYFTCNKSSRWK